MMRALLQIGSPIKTLILGVTIGAIVIEIFPCDAAANSQASQQTPNILWLMLDDLRPDALGCYGTPWAKTPNLDRIAARGVLFKNAYVQNVVCRSSRHSMLTSQYCHIVQDMEMGPEPDQFPPYFREDAYTQIDFSAVLADLGMKPFNIGKTHWSNWWIDIPYEDYLRAEWAEFDPPSVRVYGLIHIFAPQSYPPRESRHQVRWVIGGGNPLNFDKTGSGSITNAALSKLDELTSSNQPFFLRVSYFDPHIPIMTPPSFMIDPDIVDLPIPVPEEIDRKSSFERLQLAQYASVQHLTKDELKIARGSYYGLVSYVDHHIGRILDLLEERGVLDNTLIVVNSDQGIQLGEHGIYKKRNFYEQTAKVPLIFSWPQHLPQGKIFDELVELVDFVPTLMDLLDMDIPADIAGRSLMPLIRENTTSWRPAVFSEIDHSFSGYTAMRVHTGRRVMIRTEEWKMIYFLDPRVADEDGSLYNLKKDPNETRNLFYKKQFVGVIAKLKKLVDEWNAGARFEPG